MIYGPWDEKSTLFLVRGIVCECVCLPWFIDRGRGCVARGNAAPVDDDGIYIFGVFPVSDDNDDR